MLIINSTSPKYVGIRSVVCSIHDRITFTIENNFTQKRVTIPLEMSVADPSIFGIGLTDISVDSERGFLYASSKLMPHISVIDIRDDSQGDFVDRNYLDEEAQYEALFWMVR